MIFIFPSYRPPDSTNGFRTLSIVTAIFPLIAGAIVLSTGERGEQIDNDHLKGQT